MSTDDFYEELYQCFYNFCNTGIRFDVNSLKGSIDQKGSFEYFIKRAKDAGMPVPDGDVNFLNSLYSLISCAVSYDKKHFVAEKERLLKSVWRDEKKKWMFLSLLLLTYQYGVFPVAPDELKELQNQVEKFSDKCSVKFDSDVYKIKRHIKKTKTFKDEYDEMLKGEDHRLKNGNFMMILKGFSSSSPFFYPALRERFHHIPIRGGGIFLKWKKYGIAMDPGISFVDNMHRNGLFIQDINAVVVTHNHIDHNGDLSTIDDLASQFGREEIEFYCDCGTTDEFKSRMPYFCQNKKEPHTIYAESPCSNERINDDICLYFKQTEHIIEKKDEDGNTHYKKDSSFAVKLTLSDGGEVKKIIGYTSDTRYMNTLPEFFKDCDYVIANISETNEEDYKGITPKDTHMGYNGCFRLIELLV